MPAFRTQCPKTYLAADETHSITDFSRGPLSHLWIAICNAEIEIEIAMVIGAAKRNPQGCGSRMNDHLAAEATAPLPFAFLISYFLSTGNKEAHANCKVRSGIEWRPFWGRFWLVDDIDQCSKRGAWQREKGKRTIIHYVQNLNTKYAHTHPETHTPQ